MTHCSKTLLRYKAVGVREVPSGELFNMQDMDSRHMCSLEWRIERFLNKRPPSSFTIKFTFLIFSPFSITLATFYVYDQVG